jgi:hypothetical protein
MNAYAVELYKAAQRRATYFGLLLAVAAVAASLLVSPVERDEFSDYGFIAFATPMTLDLLGLFLVLTFSASLLAGELARGTIRNALVRPIRRYELYAAKLLLAWTYALGISVVIAAASWALAWFLGDLRGVTYGGEVLFSQAEMARAYAIGFGLSLLPLAAAGAFGLMFSALLRNPATAIIAPLALWLLADFVKAPLHLEPYVFTTYLGTAWDAFTARCDGIDAAWLAPAYRGAVASVVSAAAFSAVGAAALRFRSLHA